MKKIIILTFITLMLVSSGCLSYLPFVEGGGEKKTDKWNNTFSIKSLELGKSSLLPKQSTYLTMEVSNSNIHPAKNFTAVLYNTGAFEAEPLMECNFDLRSRKMLGEPDNRKCRWLIKAPGKDYLKNYESREVEMKMRISYRTTTSFQDEKPSITFKRNADPSERTFRSSSGNLDAIVEFESPQPLFKNKIPIDISIDSGEYEASDVSIEYQGAFDFSDCPKEFDMNESGVSCEIEPLGEIDIEEERTIPLRINYKYVISKGITIKVTES